MGVSFWHLNLRPVLVTCSVVNAVRPSGSRLALQRQPWGWLHRLLGSPTNRRQPVLTYLLLVPWGLCDSGALWLLAMVAFGLCL